jgi:hypothetical protein
VVPTCVGHRRVSTFKEEVTVAIAPGGAPSTVRPHCQATQRVYSVYCRYTKPCGRPRTSRGRRLASSHRLTDGKYPSPAHRAPARLWCTHEIGGGEGFFPMLYQAELRRQRRWRDSNPRLPDLGLKYPLPAHRGCSIRVRATHGTRQRSLRCRLLAQ